MQIWQLHWKNIKHYWRSFIKLNCHIIIANSLRRGNDISKRWRSKIKKT